TGSNSIFSSSSTAGSPGFYRPSTGTMQFLAQVPCLWQCPLFPSGQTIWLSPAFQTSGGNTVKALPMSALYLADFVAVPAAPPWGWMALGGTLLLAGGWAVVFRRRLTPR